MEKSISKKIYNPRDVSQLCHVSVSQVEKWLSEGTLNCFEIPGGHRRILQEDLKDLMVRQSMALPDGWPGEPEPFRILIVEDDPDLLEIFTELLHDEAWGEVRAENNGFTAGLQIAGWHPDLVLLDFLMPRISGFEICMNMRSHEETRDIPVLALTALNSEEDKKAIYQSGASDYLGKPFRSAELVMKVQALLGIEKLSKPH